MSETLKREFYELIKKKFSLFDFIQNKAPDGIWYGNFQNPPEYWVNQRFWNMLGYSLKEGSEVKPDWQNLVDKQDYQKIQELFNDPKIRQNKIKDIAIRYMHSNGSYIHVNCTAKIIHNEKGNPRMLLCHNNTDCCELTSNALKKSQERFELLIKNSIDIFVELAKDGTQLYISPVVEYYTGYTPAELQRPFSEVIHPDDLEAVLEHWQEVLAQPDQSHRHEYRHIHKTKGYVWVEAHLQSFLDKPHINSVLCWVRDIHERKEMEQALKENEKKLSESNAAKDKFFSIIAHDLRNPFNFLLGYSEIHLEQIEAQQYDKVKETSRIIKNSAEQAYELLNNLLEWSRTEQGNIKYKPLHIDVENAIENNINEFLNIAGQKNIVITSNSQPGIKCFADSDMMNSILRNLLSNAVKYSYKDGEISITAKKEQDKVKFTVKDNGVGIPKDKINKLFSIDSNINTPGTEGEKGSGLGLTLCKEFVLKNDGNIGVKSQPGEGTEFWFTLPVNHQIK